MYSRSVSELFLALWLVNCGGRLETTLLRSAPTTTLLWVQLRARVAYGPQEASGFWVAPMAGVALGSVEAHRLAVADLPSSLTVSRTRSDASVQSATEDAHLPMFKTLTLAVRRSKFEKK